MATSNSIGMWIPTRDEADESAHQKSRDLTHHISRAMTTDYAQFKLDISTRSATGISIFGPSSTISLIEDILLSNNGFNGTLLDLYISANRPSAVAIRERRQPLKRFDYFGRLPPELREAIWSMALDSRIVCIRAQAAYTRHAKSFPSTKLPLIYEVSSECQALLHTRGTMFRFFDSHHNRLHQDWFDRHCDLFYIPSIRVLYSWTGWEKALAGATVLANVLELIEDRHRGSEASEIFERLVRHGSFNGVKTFYLSLVTIECGEDLDIYGNNSMAVVDLDDKRLPDLLRPAFNNIRNKSCFDQSRVVHRTPAKLLKHLHAEWDRDLKTAFEEHWLQSRVAATKHAHQAHMFTNKRFGFDNGRQYLNRNHRLVADLVNQMPNIRPVIIFEKRWPSSDMFLFPRWREFAPTIWNQGRRFDGLEAISNRRRLVLSTELKVGRRTQYAC
ncbi:hypothetical protein F5X96DRAFT_651927 [Biscogniauxia mediterranea]|nr:hypothetical protein F5X96DRAFT_651927 [Biscogniauxia mediterranea]